MHTLDSLARAMVAPAPTRHGRHSPMLAHLVSLVCAVLPLGVMIQAYWLTA